VAGGRVELDVASLNLGDRVEARWLPLRGLVFDARGDVLEIALDGIGHSIVAPRDLLVEETERGLVTLEIVSADGTVETLRFREPLRVDVETPRADAGLSLGAGRSSGTPGANG
jgi:hypothetical protein